jgi:hypothetical protein
VHQKEIAACRRIASGRKVGSELVRFPTTTPALLALSAWPAEAKVRHVATEATGVYWKPFWHVLSDDFKLILAKRFAYPSPGPENTSQMADREGD